MVELRVSVDVDAPPEKVFAGLTDWTRQGEWMPGTQVTVVKGRGDAVGDEILARTAVPKIGRVGFDDPMRITGWEPPVRCEVLHLGRVVRGGGVFLVEPLATGSRFTWMEWVDPPLGLIGQFGLRAGRRPTQRALAVALKRFARWVERSADSRAPDQ
ncbi:MAG TPA: SRPBCC family protein [Frankiaceae bacterium]|jgi:carbon monoxide dehydrogenase subunit G|nr:SRPBCC family protein [Frankiaceae bacterium]